MVEILWHRRENRRQTEKTNINLNIRRNRSTRLKNIILKPAVLTDEEMLEIRKPPKYGYDILTQTNQSSEECKKVVLQHHERANGRGYPRGLKGEGIHLYGRICLLADVFDALSAKRPYKQQLRPFEALNVMKEEMLEHFHKELFQKFVLLFR